MAARFCKASDASGRLLRTTLTRNSLPAQIQQVRFESKKPNAEGGGVFARMIKDVKESDPDTKKAIEDMEKKAQELRESTATMQEQAAAAKERLGKLQAEAEKARLNMQQSMDKASQSVFGAINQAASSEFVQSAKKEADDLRTKVQASYTEATKAKEGEEQAKDESKEETSGASQQGSTSETSQQDAKSKSESDAQGLKDKLSGSWVGRALDMVKSAYAEEYRLAMLSEKEQEAERAEQRRVAEEARRKAEGMVEDMPMSEGSSLVQVKAKQTAWEARWGAFKDTAAGSHLNSRLQSMKNSPFFAKAKELREEMHERWETSDSRLVHSIQNTYDSMSQESEQATAMKIIRERDPEFDMIRFLARTKEDVPHVLGAFLKGELEALAALGVSETLLERMGGQVKMWQAEGAHHDHKILDIQDLELIEVKMYGENPMIILRCVTQQVNCVRDKFGNIIEGAEDDIQSVFYAWAFEQAPMPTEVGGSPPWRIQEMMVQGMQAIV